METTTHTTCPTCGWDAPRKDIELYGHCLVCEEVTLPYMNYKEGEAHVRNEQ